MANVTAKQLSEVIGVNVEKLLDQLKTAGVEVSGADDPISDDDKMKLLDSLRSSHGKEESSGPKKITLRRKSKSELRVAGTSGRNTTTKTINVEVRKKRTYVRRADVEAEEVKQQEEAEAAVEEETRQQQQQAEEEARQVEAAAQAEVEAAQAAVEEAARAEAEKKAYEKSLQEVEAAQKAIEQRGLTMIDVSHNRYHGWATGLVLAFLLCTHLQFFFKIVFAGRANRVMPHLFDHQRRSIMIQDFVYRRHRTHLHQNLDHVAGLDCHALRQIGHRNGFWNLDTANHRCCRFFKLVLFVDFTNLFLALFELLLAIRLMRGLFDM